MKAFSISTIEIFEYSELSIFYAPFLAMKNASIHSFINTPLIRRSNCLRKTLEQINAYALIIVATQAPPRVTVARAATCHPLGSHPDRRHARLRDAPEEQPRHARPPARPHARAPRHPLLDPLPFV